VTDSLRSSSYSKHAIRCVYPSAAVASHALPGLWAVWRERGHVHPVYKYTHVVRRHQSGVSCGLISPYCTYDSQWHGAQLPSPNAPDARFPVGLKNASALSRSTNLPDASSGASGHQASDTRPVRVSESGARAFLAARGACSARSPSFGAGGSSAGVVVCGVAAERPAAGAAAICTALAGDRGAGAVVPRRHQPYAWPVDMCCLPGETGA